MSEAASSKAAPGALLDADTPDTVRMSPSDASELAKGALCRIGYSDEDAQIITDQLIDNALCGYRFASLPRILAIADNNKTRNERRPIKIAHETPMSALIDGGNNLGYVSVYRATELAIKKARERGFAMVGVYDSYYSGRSAYFMEMIANAGFVGIHAASTRPHVLPIGGIKPVFGTNPLCIGFPSANGPVVYDIGTASIMVGEVQLSAHIGQELPADIAFDEHGNPTRDPNAALKGGWVPFGGHKGYGLSFAVQALGLLAGAALPQGEVKDYGFLLLVIDPKLTLPGGEFPDHMTGLVDKIKATPRRSGVDEIRIPSERSYRERDIRRKEGLVFDRKVVDSLKAL